MTERCTWNFSREPVNEPVIFDQSECCVRGRTRRIQNSMGYVQALNFHRGLASLTQRLASLAETRAFGALEENNSRKKIIHVALPPRIESLLAG